MTVEYKIKFRIILPKYSEVRSAYLWSLTVHRMGDGEFPDFDGGEVIASGKHNAADLTPLSKAAKTSDYAPPRFPDYTPDFTLQTKLHGYADTFLLENVAVIELAPAIGRHSIVAATLRVAYWPDREIASALLESCIREVNE